MLQNHPIIILEQMNAEELSFIEKKIKREQSLFFRTMRNLSFLCFIIPTIVAILFFTNDQKSMQHLNEEMTEPFTIYTYIISLLSLLTLLLGGGFLGYGRTLKRLKMDLKEKNKIIEPAVITRKYFMEINKCYYLYLKSKTKLSIEVTEQDYNQYFEGDEINLEYSRYAKEYFGYF